MTAFCLLRDNNIITFQSSRDLGTPCRCFVYDFAHLKISKRYFVSQRNLSSLALSLKKFDAGLNHSSSWISLKFKFIGFCCFWLHFISFYTEKGKIRIFVQKWLDHIVVNLYLTRVILSEYFKEYLLSIGALIKLIYKYVKS